MDQVVTVFGIPNCDQIKRARQWLSDHDIAYQFHDYKKQGIALTTLAQWLIHVELDTLINRQGTTWRKLSEAERLACQHATQALACLQQQPSLIKRPVLQRQTPNATHLLVGFDPAHYQQFFTSTTP